MLKKFLIFCICLVLVLSISMLGCKKAEEPKKEVVKETEADEATSLEDKTPYKIGAVISLTGDYSGLGEPEKKTIDMEVKRINSSGGINGYPIEVLIEDDATDADKANKATTKLLGTDGVIALIGATGTGQTMSMVTEVEKVQIPQVSMAGGNVISDPVKPWVFATPWPNGIVVDLVTDYLKSQQITKVAIISVTGGFGKDGLAVLQKKLPAAGVEIVASEVYDPTALEMKGQLTKIKGTAAQAVVMWDAGKTASIVAKDMKALQMTIPLIGSHGIARKEFVEGAADAAEGVVFPAGKILVPEAYGDTASGKAAVKFIADYTRAYSEAPNGTFPGHAYDALYIVVDALKRLGAAPDEVDPVLLRDEIEKTSKLGLIGGEFNYSPTDHAGTTKDDIIMIKVENGKFTWLKF